MMAVILKDFALLLIVVWCTLPNYCLSNGHKDDYEMDNDDLCPAVASQGWGLPDEPIQLVKPDLFHKKLVIVEENMKLLHKIMGPVATIAVVGKFHSGKSFLMNQLMGKSKGFGIGFSVRPQTMGIWMWGRPIEMKLASGKKVSVIFLDTEGFAANNISENYDAKIFAVATLLSSHLLYNSVKIIDQADIDYLELLARRTQLFALRSQMSRAKWTEFNHDLLTFPPLLWVVQDFVQITEEGETTRDWLHQLMATHTRENEDYEISLLGIFKSVDGHTLFLPAVNKRLLGDLSMADENELTPEYRRERDELIAKIQSELVPKEKNHEPIAGPQLAALLEILVMAANDGSLAEVPSRWDVFIRRLEETAVEDCYKFYFAEMDVLQQQSQNGPIEPHRLNEWHIQSLKQSMRLLHQLLFGLGDSVEQASRSLTGTITTEHHRCKDMNEKKIRLRCTEIHNQVELNVEDKFSQIALPVTTKQLELVTGRLLEETVKLFTIEVQSFVTPEVLDAHAAGLKNFVQTVSDSTTLKNNNFLEELMQKAMVRAIEVFAERTQSTNQFPRKPSSLNSVANEGIQEATTLFNAAVEIAKEERMFSANQALFKAKMQEALETLHAENEKLVVTEGNRVMKDMLGVFEDATSPLKLTLPMNTSELEIRLTREFKRVIDSYDEVMEPYMEYATVGTVCDSLKVGLTKLCALKRQENVDAFTKEVSTPLNTAKQIILLSADKYSTLFSLKQYMTEVCLLNLNEGKAKYWPQEFRVSIIEHFMKTDRELDQILRSRKSLYSYCIGFFQWIAWVLNLY